MSKFALLLALTAALYSGAESRANDDDSKPVNSEPESSQDAPAPKACDKAALERLKTTCAKISSDKLYDSCMQEYRKAEKDSGC